MNNVDSDEPPPVEHSSASVSGSTERGETNDATSRLPEWVVEDYDIPDTPDGYESPHTYVKHHYQPNMYALDIVLFSIGVGMFLTFTKMFGDFAVVFDPRQYTIVVTVGATVLTFVVHELIHAAVAKWVGAEVSFGFGMGVIRTLVDHTFQSRSETIAIALAPSVIITLAIPPILLLGSPTTSVAALVVLFVNTVGLRHDLYLVWQMLLLPSGTLIYNLDETTLVYESESEANSSIPTI